MSQVLVDTSVWVEFFRKGNRTLGTLLEEDAVVIHSFILGELVCGNFKNRKEIFGLLKSLPFCKPALHSEVIHYVESKKLYGKGIGWIDFHLMLSAKVNDLDFYTLDKKLRKAF